MSQPPYLDVRGCIIFAHGLFNDTDGVIAPYNTIIGTNVDADDYWQLVGSASTNRGGSIILSLKALPLNGKLHIREPRTDEKSEG